MLRQQGPNLTDASIDSIVAMVNNISLVPQGRRWDRSVLQFALGFWNRSPTAYVDATYSGTLLLPSVRLLQYCKNSVDQRPGGHITQMCSIRNQINCTLCAKLTITFNKNHKCRSMYVCPFSFTAYYITFKGVKSVSIYSYNIGWE